MLYTQEVGVKPLEHGNNQEKEQTINTNGRNKEQTLTHQPEINKQSYRISDHFSVITLKNLNSPNHQKRDTVWVKKTGLNYFCLQETCLWVKTESQRIGSSPPSQH